MKPRIAVRLILAAAGALMWPGCSTPPSPGESPQPRDEAVSAANTVEAHARFATGVSYELNEKPDLALEEFRLAALADPANEPLVIEVSRRLIQIRETEKALELLSKSAARADATGELFVWLSRARLIEGRHDQAIAAAETAIQRSPDKIGGYQSLAEARLQMKDPAGALKTLQRASERKNADALFLINLAGLYSNYLTHNPANEAQVKIEAVALLDRAVQLKPDNPNLIHRLADIYQSMGSGDKAVDLYLHLLSEHSEIPYFRDTIREKLTNLFLQLQDKERAAEQLRATIRDNPTRFPQAYYLLGLLAYEGGDFAEAEDLFRKTLLLNPRIERAHYDLAGAQISAQRAAEGLQTLERAAGLFGRTFEIEFYSALAYGRLENHPAALRHFTAAEVIARATDTSRLTPSFLFQLGAASERNKDFDQAASYFRKAIEAEPGFAEALNYLGYMWADLGIHLEESLELIQKALEIEPESAAFLDSLAWVLHRLDRNEEALIPMLKAVDLIEEPDPILFDHLGDIYRSLGDLEKARDSWNKSLAIEPNEEIQNKLEGAVVPVP